MEKSVNKQSISRVLTSLKGFTETFKSKVANTGFYDIYKAGRSYIDNKTVEESTVEIETAIQSTRDQIESVFRKRAAINAANNETVITVNGRHMTISDALIYKKHCIPLLETQLQILVSQASNTRNSFAKVNGDYEKDAKAVSAEDLDKYATMFKPEVLTISDRFIESLREEINSFKVELNGILSEQNALVQIEV